MKTLYRFLLILIIGFQCTIDTATESRIAKLYSDQELKDVKRIVDFVKSQILSDCMLDDHECYEAYFNSFAQIPASANFVDLKISIDSQLELFNSLDSALYSDIWYFYPGKAFIKGQEYEGTLIGVNIHGRFADILRHISATNDQLEVYVEPFNQVGHYSASMNAILLRQANHRFNLQSEDEFFLIAVHLLTLNYEMHKVGLKPVPNKP